MSKVRPRTAGTPTARSDEVRQAPRDFGLLVGDYFLHIYEKRLRKKNLKFGSLFGMVSVKRSVHSVLLSQVIVLVGFRTFGL